MNVILKGVAGERGEQGPPGVNGFQVCLYFWLILEEIKTIMSMENFIHTFSHCFRVYLEIKALRVNLENQAM